MRGGRRGSRGTAARTVAALLLAGFGFLSASASAQPAAILASESDFEFVGSPFEQPQGEVATFINPSGSSAPHNVYSSGRGPDGGFLFFSETIYPNSETPVPGTQYLASGTYPFVCTLHPGMAGTLQVTGSGTPVPRPSVKVIIPAQPLATVLRKGALRITLSSPIRVEGASVTVRVGKKVIGFVRSVTVPVGFGKAITARLFPEGKGVLKGKKSVTVSATSSVVFGKPSTSRKVLR